MNKMLLITYITILGTFYSPVHCPPGIKSPGATCYANATLQALFACDPFVKKIHELDSQNQFKQRSIGHELFNFMLMHLTTEGAPVESKDFITCISNNDLLRGLDVTSQQDATEFFTNLIDKLDPSNSLGIAELFNLSVINHVECVDHKHDFPYVSSKIELPITENGKTLQQLLSGYFSKNQIEECPTRPDIKAQASFEQALLKKAPEILVISPIRVTYNSAAGKDTRVIHYDLKAISLTVGNDNVTYKPRAIVLHTGNSPSSGHYIALINSNDRWLVCDDSSVVTVDDVTAQKIVNGEDFIILNQSLNDGQGGMVTYQKYDSYIFFFERVELVKRPRQKVNVIADINKLFNSCVKKISEWYVGLRLHR